MNSFKIDWTKVAVCVFWTTFWLFMVTFLFTIGSPDTFCCHTQVLRAEGYVAFLSGLYLLFTLE
jgi:hypothetical protein